LTAAAGLTTSSSPPNTVAVIQPGMNVQPVVLVDQNGNYVASSVTLTATTVSTSATVSTAYRLYLINAASGNLTMTMPSPSANTGTAWFLKRTDNTTSVVTIAPNSAELIDGASSGYVPNSVGAVEIVSDGTNWWII
jgi:hypothetical protein